MLGLVMIALMLSSPAARAHHLQITVSSAEAVVLRLHYADGTAFSSEKYEIYPEHAEDPVQVGRTDHSGQIAFVPDVAGTWRLRAFSEDGHGQEMTFRTDDAGTAERSSRPLFDRYPRLFTGAGLLLGIFGLLSLLLRRRKPAEQA